MRNFFENKKNLYAIIFSFIFIWATVFFKDKKAEAQLGVLSPFGGTISNVQYCCNGIIITVDSVSGGNFGGDFFMDYASIANPTVNYANYQVFYGGNQPTVGLAFPVGVCIDIGSECEDADSVSGGTIMMIGTGLPGGN